MRPVKPRAWELAGYKWLPLDCIEPWFAARLTPQYAFGVDWQCLVTDGRAGLNLGPHNKSSHNKSSLVVNLVLLAIRKQRTMRLLRPDAEPANGPDAHGASKSSGSQGRRHQVAVRRWA